MEVGAGQSGAELPAGAPADVVALALKTFHQAFTAAMKSTMILPLAVLGLATLSVLLVKQKAKARAAQPEAVVLEPAIAEN
jgi:hypothetical protein